MDHKGRLARLRQAIEERKLDLLLITHLPNIHYLCGFTGSSGALFVTESAAVFFTDGRYADQARAQVQGSTVKISRKSALTATAEYLGGRSLRRIGIEAAHLTVAERKTVSVALGKSSNLIDAPPMVEELRQVKDSEEIARIRAACHLGCE